MANSVLRMVKDASRALNREDIQLIVTLVVWPMVAIGVIVFSQPLVAHYL